MGKDKNEELIKAPSKLRSMRKPRHVADWEAVDGELLKRAIVASCANGGAIRLGYSRDGGAYALGIYGDGDPYTIYCGASDDIAATLLEIAETFE